MKKKIKRKNRKKLKKNCKKSKKTSMRLLYSNAIGKRIWVSLLFFFVSR